MWGLSSPEWNRRSRACWFYRCFICIMRTAELAFFMDWHLLFFVFTCLSWYPVTYKEVGRGGLGESRWVAL